MGKPQDWKKATALRKTVKDMKTKSVKCSRPSNIKGGLILTDETAKPYKEELSKLEAKLTKEKEKMSTGERVDTAAAEVMADPEQNEDKIKEYIAEQFAKSAPKKVYTTNQQMAVHCCEGEWELLQNPIWTNIPPP